jgi:DNA-nicking Smr family endonuclease
MNGDDESLFRDEMAGVTPLESESRVSRKRHIEERSVSMASRREAALREEAKDRNTLSDAGIKPIDSWYVLSFKRPGVQNGVFRRLKQGRYEALARLDLHRMSIERARREVFEFVEESYGYGLRSVMLIHGKGENRIEGESSSILKGCVDHWLRELEIVQAFHSAQPQHGGTGAVYVLLKKSEERKRETRERFTKGRVSFDND